MPISIAQALTNEFSLQLWQVENTMKLLAEGATIPFIARYRKEVTGSLDDTQLRDMHERLTYLENLEKRREEVIAAIEGLEQMSPELLAALQSATALVTLEDLYRPYRPKRRTRASIAREKGLEPLAIFLLACRQDGNPLAEAEAYIDTEKDVADATAALDGAKDIIAEMVSDNADVRGDLRSQFLRTGLIATTAAKDEDSVFATYYNYDEPLSRLPGHRILAINRGEREGFLKVSVDVDNSLCLDTIYTHLLPGQAAKTDFPSKPYLLEAGADAFARLIAPSLENEVRNLLTERAADSAIKVFGENLHQLLMQPPVKDRVVLGLDPAYRTGCKIAVVDATGLTLATTVVYPTPPANKTAEAKKILTDLIAKHNVSVISIGNGTASRESELFVADLISGLDRPVAYMVVSEAGASVYSASKLAAEEFPEFDVSLRSAVSIARRIQDPLAELVKIDPKAIGVGQYQHDMPPAKLSTALGGVVESCVNTVGADLNTASFSLLAYVAGINTSVAKNIVSYREENGRFTDRKQLLKVPKLGKKAFEQCAGFLRVKDGKHILDNTAVHPESYAAAQVLLGECGYALADVSAGHIADLKHKAQTIGLTPIAAKAGVGVPTLQDIIDELLKPGRDPRDSLPPPILRTDVLSMEDLEPEMILTGTVRNVIDFGAFVDIGVHQDGLVHISQLSDRFIKHPLDAVKIGDIVKVKVLSVDIAKKRISLTMKGLSQA